MDSTGKGIIEVRNNVPAVFSKNISGFSAISAVKGIAHAKTPSAPRKKMILNL
jgi:hypothetical protein